MNPKVISHQGNIFRKPQDIANVANTYFISKVTGFRDRMKDDQRDPMTVLKYLMLCGVGTLDTLYFIIFISD